MRKVFDYLVFLAIAAFSVAYSINTPFREAVFGAVRTIYSRPLAQNAREIPQEIVHGVVGGCPAPITYRIGDIDPRFGVTREQVMEQLQQAAEAWNAVAGAELLTYRDDGTMPVSLIYDDRQALAVEIQKESGTLATQEDKLNYINQKYDTLKKSIGTKTTAYTKAQAKYDKALSGFEDDVRKYEADPAHYDQKVYESLQKERKKIQQMFADLESQRKDLNASVNALNALVNNANTLKSTFNANADVYNTSVSTKQQIEEDFAGVYFSDRRIEIYQFLNMDELRSVLIHEIGHALRFEHNPDPQSIMYYEAKPEQVLTDADKQSAKDLCK